MGSRSLSDQIINKARSLGALLAGIASVELLKKSPSQDIYTKIESNQGVGSRDFAEGIKPGEVAWPPSAKSALVIALAHKEDDLQLDGHEEPVGAIKFCQLCELSCPVGKG